MEKKKKKWNVWVEFFQGQSSRIRDADGILPMLKMFAAAICIYLQRCLAPLKGRRLTLRKKHWPHSASATQLRSFWMWGWTFASGLFACVDHSPHANERSTSCLRVQYILLRLIMDLSLTISVYPAVFCLKRIWAMQLNRCAKPERFVQANLPQTGLSKTTACLHCVLTMKPVS